jgi:hypothetical protein
MLLYPLIFFAFRSHRSVQMTRMTSDLMPLHLAEPESDGPKRSVNQVVTSPFGAQLCGLRLSEAVQFLTSVQTLVRHRTIPDEMNHVFRLRRHSGHKYSFGHSLTSRSAIQIRFCNISQTNILQWEGDGSLLNTMFSEMSLLLN